MSTRSELYTVFDEINRTLRAMALSGCRGFDSTPETLERIAAWEQRPQTPAESLAAIRQKMGNCKRCGLARTRQRIVFGAGNPNAALMFIGEGPGYDEDQQGEPFVGKAGQLLTRIIKAMQLTRPEVYIGNVIKCRPPGNRNPTPEEVGQCAPFIKGQVAAVKPRVIVALGTFAAQTLLNSTTPISRMRGMFHDYGGIKLMPTYHPAYLLRHEEKKREVWEDMKQVMKALGQGT